MLDARRFRSQLPQWLPLVCGWLLGLICFSLPGRDGPDSLGSLDMVALLKVAIRMGSFGVLSILLIASWNHPRRRLVLTVLAPYAAFAAWAIVTASWSAHRAISLGQALGLIDLLLICACVAIHWRGADDVSRVLWHLTWALFLFSLVIVAADVISHDVSGLNRTEWSDLDGGSSGLAHPTTAGATASLGLVLIWASWSLGGWRWSQRLLVPATVVHCALLLAAASRTAMIMAAVVLGILFVLRARPTVIAATVALAGFAGMALLTLDPGLESIETPLDVVVEKFTRGESSESLSSLTGRTDLWDAIWASYWDSPIIGHGYFVTSRAGEIDVWSGPSNRTAHNAMLQVLVTTGAVGLMLFLSALAFPIVLVVRSYLAQPSARPGDNGRLDPPMALLLACVAIWFAGWAQLSESFMGPVQPESIVFYCVFAVAIAHVRPSLLFAERRAGRASALALGGEACE
jgi:O-antigen ligase